jgi:serine/threonine-protein kinase
MSFSHRDGTTLLLALALVACATAACSSDDSDGDGLAASSSDATGNGGDDSAAGDDGGETGDDSAGSDATGSGDGDDSGGDGDATGGDGDDAPPASTSSGVEGPVFAGHCGAAPGQIFPPDAPWNRSVRDAPVDPASGAIVDYLDATVTGGQTFRIDMGEADETYGFQLLSADDGVEHRPFTRTDDFYETACDATAVPVPPNGRLEGELGYRCDSDGDCHLLVFDTDECRLFEMWRADQPDGDFRGGCLAVWDTRAVQQQLRGLSCTSADAAGLPIMPLLFTPQQIADGEIRHALRFILPNGSVQREIYARPATHNPLTTERFGEPDPGPAGTRPAPYGVRLRLRADFDDSSLSAGARVITAALKEYGMFHADGGNVTFIASNAAGSARSWSDVGLGPNDLRDALSWTDFEVVSDLGDVGSMADTDCTRTALDEL